MTNLKIKCSNINDLRILLLNVSIKEAKEEKIEIIDEIIENVFNWLNRRSSEASKDLKIS